jgi:hypothetical protein
MKSMISPGSPRQSPITTVITVPVKSHGADVPSVTKIPSSRVKVPDDVSHSVIRQAAK